MENLRTNCSLHNVSFNVASVTFPLMAAVPGDNIFSEEYHSEY